MLDSSFSDRMSQNTLSSMIEMPDLFATKIVRLCWRGTYASPSKVADQVVHSCLNFSLSGRSSCCGRRRHNSEPDFRTKAARPGLYVHIGMCGRDLPQRWC